MHRKRNCIETVRWFLRCTNCWFKHKEKERYGKSGWRRVLCFKSFNSLCNKIEKTARRWCLGGWQYCRLFWHWLHIISDFSWVVIWIFRERWRKFQNSFLVGRFLVCIYHRHNCRVTVFSCWLRRVGMIRVFLHDTGFFFQI